MERALVEATRRAAGAVLERWFALELLVEDGECRGVLAAPPAGDPVEVRARNVVLATGGVGQLFAVTTNPSEATGDGVAMALRAGVPVTDAEFVQFHPTALHHPAMPRPLLSEALRGHGAILRDARGERFVDELASRDVVSRAMAARMDEQGVAHLWLDATGLVRFAQRFPTIAASLATIGLDPATDWLPIAPAAHHLSGGVVTDLWGATALPGLWAAGEVACTGVHGANRLASNSLLEGMVYGARLSERIAGGHRGATATGAMRAVAGPRAVEPPEDSLGRPRGLGSSEALVCGRAVRAATRGANSAGIAATAPGGRGALSGSDVGKLRGRVQQAMTAGAGVVRSGASLSEAARSLEEVADELRSELLERGPVSTAADRHEVGELANLLTVGSALLQSATERLESRGAHVREDYPESDPAFRVRLVHNRGDDAEQETRQ